MKNMEALHYSEDHITVDTFGTLHIRGEHFSQGADPPPLLPAPTVSWMKNMEALSYSEDHITVDTFGTLHIRGAGHFSQGADPHPLSL
jgi:hypothetical protein